MPALHSARPKSNKDSKRCWVIAVNGIQYFRLRIERHIPSDRRSNFVRFPNVPRASECEASNSKRRMMIGDSQTDSIVVTQQLVLVHQLQPRVQVISVEKIDSRLGEVAVQVKDLASVILVIATPNQTRSPITSIKTTVVTYRCRCSSYVARFQWFRITQETVTDLN